MMANAYNPCTVGGQGRRIMNSRTPHVTWWDFFFKGMGYGERSSRKSLGQQKSLGWNAWVWTLKAWQVKQGFEQRKWTRLEGLLEVLCETESPGLGSSF